MGIANAPGVSFCWVGDDPIFLDLARDRYLALSPDAGQALRRIVEGAQTIDGDKAHIDHLIARGLLAEAASETAPLPCGPVRAATVSLADGDSAGIAVHRWSAAADVMRARASLRMFGLARMLARVRHRKSEVVRGAGRTDEEQLGMQLARSFRAADTMLGSLDLCVPRSVALALRAAKLGYRCDLIVGVKLRSFAAHCWVQRDDILINEQVDVARQFTPVLVI